MRPGINSIRKRKAFTLVELMVTVAILSFGIVVIYEALFVSMDTFGFYANYLDTQEWMDEKIMAIRDELMRTQTLEEGVVSGQLVRDQKTYDWTVFISIIDEKQKLYRAEVTLSWKQGRKRVETSRATFLLPPQLKEYAEENFV